MALRQRARQLREQISAVEHILDDVETDGEVVDGMGLHLVRRGISHQAETVQDLRS